ncbi:MAG TPA: hypothetical protein VGI39_07120 [Polyangiaceae bacterium]
MASLKWPSELGPPSSQRAIAPPDAPPPSYREAILWLDGLGGTYLTSRLKDGTCLVSVGAFGRSADAVAVSMEPADLERALLEAVHLLYTRL